MSQTTSLICMPRKLMLKVLMLNYSGLWMGVAFIGAAVLCIGGAFFDTRIWILALMWIFLIIPLLVGFLYFNYGLMPLTALNCIPHVLIFRDSELEMKIKAVPTKSGSGEKDEEEKIVTEIEDPVYEGNILIQKEDFNYMKSGGDYVILFFRPSNKGWLWVPVSAFPSVEDFRNAIEPYIRKETVLQKN